MAGSHKKSAGSYTKGAGSYTKMAAPTQRGSIQQGIPRDAVAFKQLAKSL